MKLSTIADWLDWIGNIHAVEIELGLDRVREVAERLGVRQHHVPVIIVGGTNGKGSTVAGLEAIYRMAGYRVGAFTSPIIFKHNEQVRINGQDASDEDFCDAFAKVAAASEQTSLTPFEFHTLAALVIFKSKPLDVLILEVGLGGRLDAVNIIDADLAIVTTIAIDHVEWLGSTREEIAYEKAGIFRGNQLAVCGDFDPPTSLTDYAKKIGAKLFMQEKNFSAKAQNNLWSWQSSMQQYQHLPRNHLALQNMSTVLMAVTLLQSRLPVLAEAIQQGLKNIKIIGRVDVIHEPVIKIFDVSHNPASIAYLAERLNAMNITGKTHAVFSMLSDKDMQSSIGLIQSCIDEWHIAPLPIKRGVKSEMLQTTFAAANIPATLYPSVEAAYDAANHVASAGDCIVIFGSFHVIAAILQHRERFQASRM